MRGELLQAESDTFLAFVEAKDNDIDFLVELDNLFRIGDATPREVGDVDETVHAAEIDECTVRNDVLDRTFENLTLFELADDLVLLGFDFGLDESLVGNHHVLVLVVDLDHLEFHSLVNIDVIVADGLDIDLGAGQEGLDAEHVDDQAAFGFALDITGDDLLVVVSLVDALPRFEDEGAFVGELELAVGVFLAFHIDFDFVADLEVGIVTKLGGVDDTVGLEADVDHDFAGVDGNDLTHNDGVFVNGLEGLAVELFQSGFLVGGICGFLVVDFIPVKVLERAVRILEFSHLARSGSGFSHFSCGSSGFCDLFCGFSHVFHLVFDLSGHLFGVVDNFFRHCFVVLIFPGQRGFKV